VRRGERRWRRSRRASAGRDAALTRPGPKGADLVMSVGTFPDKWTLRPQTRSHTRRAAAQAGVALASASDLTFNWTGFISAMVSNLTFGFRAVWSKRRARARRRPSGPPVGVAREELAAASACDCVCLRRSRCRRRCSSWLARLGAALPLRACSGSQPEPGGLVTVACPCCCYLLHVPTWVCGRCGDRRERWPVHLFVR
jgi:hypothetical protein